MLSGAEKYSEAKNIKITNFDVDMWIKFIKGGVENEYKYNESN
jgi:hypothetical protein